MMQSSKIIASLFQTVLNMFWIWCNQKNYCSTISNDFEHVWIWCNQNKLLHHFYQCFQTSLYLFKRWCSQNKLLYHYFQIVLNIFKISCNQYKLLHHYFQTVLNMFQIWCNNIWTCSRGDAMKLNYCITLLHHFFSLCTLAKLAWAGLFKWYNDKIK